MLIISGAVIIYYSTTCAWAVYYTIYSCRTVLPWTSCANTWNTEYCVENMKLITTRSSTVLKETQVNKTMAFTTKFAGNSSENGTLFHTAAEEFWLYKVLSITSGLEHLGGIKWELAICHLVTWILIFSSLAKGIKSIGKVVYVTATMPYVFLFILLVRGVTLPGGPQGLLVFIIPDFNKLLDVQVWVTACGQVFFSLGPGYGGLISMASYNTFHSNCLRNAIICTLACGGSSLFAGLVVFAFLGSMAHEANVPITDVLSSGPGLGFIIYPEAVAQLPVPQIWSVLFFAMLILLVQDSLFSTVETVISAILDEYPFLLRWRIPVTAAYCLVSFLLGLIFTTEGGMYVHQLVDWYIASIFLISAGFLECITFGWVYGVNRISADVALMIGRPAPLFFRIAWSSITPAMLLSIFIFTLVRYRPPTYGNYIYPDYAASLGWCLAVVPCIPLVTVMWVIIYKEEGSVLQRMKKSLKPDRSWGPGKSSCRDVYCRVYRAHYIRNSREKTML
ncbi:sodium- and chloride-dependent glycine transporter 2-like [Haliotis asinina]|uniref:sodium- and chloride-dependent glycine transporter 2-like n=1 Tax=Haliotis asinina TaxID=109174 RepID=UPI0035325D51